MFYLFEEEIIARKISDALLFMQLDILHICGGRFLKLNIVLLSWTLKTDKNALFSNWPFFFIASMFHSCHFIFVLKSSYIYFVQVRQCCLSFPRSL